MPTKISSALLSLCFSLGTTNAMALPIGQRVTIDTWNGSASGTVVDFHPSTGESKVHIDGRQAYEDNWLYDKDIHVGGAAAQPTAKPPAAQNTTPKTQLQPSAANEQLKHKVGDRIECQVTGNWQPGTIVKVQLGGDGELFYLVNNDGEASAWDRWASSSQIRARTGLISETAKARNELTALGALEAPKAGSLDETFQKLIRERYELQGGKEFPVTVTFQGFLIGHTHPYGRADVYGESADGPGGTANTIVYPVSAQYIHRHAYRDAFLIYQQDEVYKCFKNSFGKWQCNPASGGKGMINKFREERAG